MTIETRIRDTLRSKLRVQVTRRKRGPFILQRPDGTTTEHPNKKSALNTLLVSARCMNQLCWQIKPKKKGNR